MGGSVMAMGNQTRRRIGGLLLTLWAAAATCTAAADPVAKPTAATAGSQALPAPGTYKIDPAHSFAYFGAQHHIVGLIRGRFDQVSGTIVVAQDPAACRVEVTIDPASLSTQVGERDQDLRGSAYFDVGAFPTITYSGRGIRRASATSWTIDGSLTIHGVTQVVPLTFTYKGAFSDQKPGTPARVAFHGAAGTKRADFKMGLRDKGEVGSPLEPDVDIEIDVEADATAAQH
jgi:polyisoprenoid-binding protein YceI